MQSHRIFTTWLILASASALLASGCDRSEPAGGAAAGAGGASPAEVALAEPALRPGEEYVQMVGSNVSLIMPPGFTLAPPGIAGIAHQDKQILISVDDTIKPATEAQQDVNAIVEDPSVELIQKTIVPVSGGSGPLYEMMRVSDLGAKQHMLMLVIGDVGGSVVVTALFPEKLSEEDRQLVRRIMTNLHWNRIDPTYGYDYRIAATDKLQPMHAIPARQRLYLTPPVTEGADKTGNPEMLFYAAAVAEPITDRAAWCREAILKDAERKDITIESTEQFDAGGVTGYEVIAGAKDAVADDPLVLYQAVYFVSDTRFYVGAGIVGEAGRQTFVPEFQKIARSFRLVK